MDEVVFQRFVDGDDAAFTFISNNHKDIYKMKTSSK